MTASALYALICLVACTVCCFYAFFVHCIKLFGFQAARMLINICIVICVQYNCFLVLENRLRDTYQDHDRAVAYMYTEYAS